MWNKLLEGSLNIYRLNKIHCILGIMIMPHRIAVCSFSILFPQQCITGLIETLPFAPSSGSWLHQECISWPSAEDITGGGVQREGVLAAQRGVWARSGSCGHIRVCLILARTHPHAPAVPCEAWGWRVSFHRVRALRGSLVRVCPTIQRLPVCLPDCPGGTSEFLWLPFRLRKCFVVA